jgi:5-methylcytosine-specific restriction endonuclease McrA
MPQYKVITTLTWRIDDDLSHEECLQRAKQQLEEILDSNPQGEDFDGFSVQIDLAQMKDRKKLVHLGEFDLDDVMPYVTESESKRDYHVGDKTYTVKMNSDRYFVFKNNNRCVACGLEGTKMILDMNPGDHSPHFNLYAIEDGRYVLMTKDHVLAKACGGTDELSNYATCCAICNNLKGHYDLSYEQVNELRDIHNNKMMIPRKELREIINQTRDKMIAHKQ